MEKICGAKGCSRPVLAGGLCATHYQRKRRGIALETPIRPVGVGDQWTNIVFRAPQDLKAEAEEAAKREGIDASEWWRRAGARMLQTPRKRRS